MAGEKEMHRKPNTKIYGTVDYLGEGELVFSHYRSGK
jgi:hypothetical protein